ncbi:MAG: RidA family protein [Bacillati bacterium ANGP1]|uniref:RidA family protein n=1 Tax=Candidatus Segetimicrobium genomatis TaxID=2569760 RepID=A0A537JLP9_9BACT|nr:MAG: RidA family protein [Terrabacteria group bacterium ANGP1]
MARMEQSGCDHDTAPGASGAPRGHRGGWRVRREDVAVRGVHKTTGYWQVAQDIEGSIVVRGDIEAQAVQVFEKLKAVLSSARASLDDVVKLTTYTTSVVYRAKIVEVRARYFKTYFPPNTFIVVAGLATPDYLLEIEAVAACP